MPEIDLRCCSCDELIASLPIESVDFVHSDPPWAYSKAAPPGHGRVGQVGEHYEGVPTDAIARTICSAAPKAKADAYLALWCTWPMLEQWILEHAAARPLKTPRQSLPRWEQLTGGSWGKTDNRRGIGHHLLGDTEPLLVYRRGAPRPQPPGPISNDWRAPRRTHSAKPVEVLAKLVRWACPPGGLVLDLYAGASASLARACVLTGRRYLGAEIDPVKHATACQIIDDVRIDVCARST